MNPTRSDLKPVDPKISRCKYYKNVRFVKVIHNQISAFTIQKNIVF